MVFRGPSILEEALSVWCWRHGGEYSLECSAESGPDDPVRFSLFPESALPPEEAVTSLKGALFNWSGAAGVDFDTPEFRIRPVRNDWARMWKRFFRGRDVGRRLHIAPPWEESHPEDRLLLTIDPGASFGTGHHPTTVLCIEFLEDRELSGKHILDAGCGSGVLSLAAVLLGAAETTGFDNDPEAVATAVANARRIGLDSRCAFLIGSEETVDGMSFDLILCNMLPRYSLPMLPALLGTLRPGGVFFLSGMDVGVFEDTRARLEAVSLKCRDIRSGGGWSACLLEKS